MTKARVIKFGTQVGYIKLSALWWQTTPNQRDQHHSTILKTLGAHHVFGIGEARQFKYSVQADINEYFYMHDRLPANEYVRVT